MHVAWQGAWRQLAGCRGGGREGLGEGAARGPRGVWTPVSLLGLGCLHWGLPAGGSAGDKRRKRMENLQAPLKLAGRGLLGLH
jgi:hypothetical protein